MNLKDQINETLKLAMKENDNEKKRVLRTLLASIKNIEIDKRTSLTDQEIISVLHKEIKIRNESIEGAQKNNRQDLIDEAQAEIKFIHQFIPVGLTDEELINIAHESITRLGAKNASDMGKVMKDILPIINGRAPNSQVSQLIKDLLTP